MSQRAGWLILAAALVYGAPAHALEFTAQAALAGDYRWRGLTMSDEDPSLQLSASAAFDSGAWTWAELNSVSDTLGGAELGAGAGYDATFAALDWSLGVAAYVYDADDLNYVEIDLSVRKAFGPFALSAGIDYTPEQDNVPDANPYIWLGANAQFGRFDLHGHVGQDDGLIDTSGRTLDYSVGAGVAVDRWSADLSFVDSEAADSAWVLRLAREFSL